MGQFVLGQQQLSQAHFPDFETLLDTNSVLNETDSSKLRFRHKIQIINYQFYVIKLGKQKISLIVKKFVNID